jgi:hypothetical protein
LGVQRRCAAVPARIRGNSCGRRLSLGCVRPHLRQICVVCEKRERGVNESANNQLSNPRWQFPPPPQATRGSRAEGEKCTWPANAKHQQRQRQRHWPGEGEESRPREGTQIASWHQPN